MKTGILQKKMPTYLGLLFITVGIVVTSLLVKNSVLNISQASPTRIPNNIKISNVSDTSFVISYTTLEQTTGVISMGKDATLSQTVLDDQDQKTGKVTEHTVHYFTIKNLLPNTKYYYSIISGEHTILSNNKPFEITTGTSLTEAFSDNKDVTGTVIALDGTAVVNGIVYLTLGNSQTVSALLDSKGMYSIPLSIRTADLSSYIIPTPDSLISLSINTASLKSAVKVKVRDAHPVPIVTLSRNYDFSFSTDPLNFENDQTASSSGKLSVDTFASESAKNKEPQIITPNKNETFSDQQPQFKGVASPGAELIIEIHSEENIQAEVKADSKGNWTYRPTTPLSAGEHTISITTKDQFGILKTITQAFTVYAAGTQVNQSATPSATPTTRPIAPTTTPTPTPTKPPTATPTVIPSATPTMVPTVQPTNVPVTQGGNTLPPPGNSTFLFSILAATLAIGTGIVLFLVTKGGTPIP